MAGQRDEKGRRATKPQFDWKRYWIRSALWMLAFNILAILLAWYVILPRLHPQAFGAG
jgi:hypothetical protein